MTACSQFVTMLALAIAFLIIRRSKSARTRPQGPGYPWPAIDMIGETEKQLPLDHPFHALFERNREGIIVTDPYGRILSANPAFNEMLGYAPRDSIAQENLADIHEPAQLAAVAASLSAKLGRDIPSGFEVLAAEVMQGQERESEWIWLRKDGTPIPVLLAIHALTGTKGPICGFLAIARGLTERNKLLERVACLEAALGLTTEAILIADADTCILEVNQAFIQCTGYRAEEVRGRTPAILASPRHDEAFRAHLWTHVREDGHWEGETWDQRKDGSVYPAWLRANLIRDPTTGQPHYYIAAFTDISQRKTHEEQIKRIAYHDPLTGLPNRILFHDRLQQAIFRARRDRSRIAILFIDVDRFKDINDTLGHQVGDGLLIEVAACLYRCMRETDTIARLGGDEFVILLPGIQTATDAATVAEKVLSEMETPLYVDSHILHVTTSIGIGIFPEDGRDTDTLIKNTDAALYHAKDSGRNTHRFFDSALNQASHERVLIDRHLRLALERSEFELHYQPNLSLASGKIVSCEALIRWRHPEWGLISPDKFIAVAEETGLIVPLGEWVMREAALEAARWCAAGYEVRIAVNFSGRQLRDPRFAERLQALLHATGLSPARYELEITESTFIEGITHARETLSELKDLGVHLAIDDFGTGYSSLAYLKTFAIDKLKIDRSFVRDIDANANNAAIVRAVVSLAHELGLEVVAEGVETLGQLNALSALGCDTIQGFYVSPPLPGREFSDFLETHHPKTHRSNREFPG